MATADDDELELDDEDQLKKPKPQPSQAIGKPIIANQPTAEQLGYPGPNVGKPITPAKGAAPTVPAPEMGAPSTTPAQSTLSTMTQPTPGGSPGSIGTPIMAPRTPRPTYHGVNRVLDTLAGATNIGSAIEAAGGLGTEGWRQKNADEERQIEQGEKERQAAATTEGTQGRAAESQARAAATTAGMENVMITLPGGGTITVPKSQLGPDVRALISGQTSQANTAANVAGRQGVAETNVAGRENVAATQQAGALDRLKTSTMFQRWKAQLDNDTKIRVAQLAAGKAPAQMLETAEFANGGLSQLQDAQAAMQVLEQKGVMGTLPANWVENWIFKNGAVDPSLDPETRQEIGRLRAALNYTSSAAMRAHTGRTSQEIYEDFKNTLGPGQDWDALRGAIEQTNEMLGQYAQAGTNANIAALRSGAPPPTGPAAPAGGGPVASHQPQEGDTRTNKRTHEVQKYTGGQWQTVQPPKQ